MYKEFVDSGDILLRAKSEELCESPLEQIVLPSVFHTEEVRILEEHKVDGTTADHRVARGPIHFQKTQDPHLM
jgi:hypothetical protein